ncbi:hypothetical protein KUCAC02_016524, partial [Chaenocephalus aceratus]
WPHAAEANPAIPGGSKTGEQQHITTFCQAPLANSSTRSKAITDAIAFFICKDIQPYSVTENEGFLHLLHILEPRYHTRVFNEVHTGNNLAMLLQEVCREWKIEDNNPALVTDNARNMILAGVGAQLEPHVRCIAHTLNLASQKALKVDRVSELLVKMRKVVTYFHKCPKATEALREMQIQLHLPHHKLVHDVSTRWKSSLDMLERFWEQQPAVLNTLMSNKIRRGEARASLTEDDMTLIPEVIKLMSPLKVATTLLSEEKNPTISMISPIQTKLRRQFQSDESDHMVISQMKERFRLDFDGRYTYLQDLLHYASALDPRFKDLAFLDDNETKDRIMVKMDGQAGDGDTLNEDQAAETEDDVLPMKKTALDQMFGDFLPARSPVKTTKERAKEEILKYRERDALGWSG